MTTYYEYFERSWGTLLRLGKRKKFEPFTEQDVICMMYHLCLKKLKDPKLIHARSSYGEDFVMGHVIGEKGKHLRLQGGHGLLAEFKYANSQHRVPVRFRGCKEDIRRLSRHREKSLRKVCVLLAKGNWILDKKKRLVKFGQKHGVDVFCDDLSH